MISYNQESQHAACPIPEAQFSLSTTSGWSRNDVWQRMLESMQLQLEQNLTRSSMAPGNFTLCRWVNNAERFGGNRLIRNAETIYATTDSNIPEDSNFIKAAVGTLDLLK